MLGNIIVLNYIISLSSAAENVILGGVPHYQKVNIIVFISGKVIQLYFQKCV